MPDLVNWGVSKNQQKHHFEHKKRCLRKHHFNIGSNVLSYRRPLQVIHKTRSPLACACLMSHGDARVSRAPRPGSPPAALTALRQAERRHSACAHRGWPCAPAALAPVLGQSPSPRPRSRGSRPRLWGASCRPRRIRRRPACKFFFQTMLGYVRSRCLMLYFKYGSLPRRVSILVSQKKSCLKQCFPKPHLSCLNICFCCFSKPPPLR